MGLLFDGSLTGNQLRSAQAIDCKILAAFGTSWRQKKDVSLKCAQIDLNSEILRQISRDEAPCCNLFGKIPRTLAKFRRISNLVSEF